MLHGRTRPFARTAASSPVVPAAVVNAWEAAVIANGGTVSAGRKTIVTSFVSSEVAAGTWSLTDDYWPLWAENAPQALTSLKQLRLATVTAAPAFTVDRGYLFDGVANFINTGFIVGTHTVNITAANLRIGVYVRNDTTGLFYSAGCQSGTNINLTIIARNGAAAAGYVNCASATLTLPVATTPGFTVASKTNSSLTINGYKNGVALANGTVASAGATLPLLALYIGARNLAGAAGGFRADATGFVCVGAPLSPAQELAQYNNIQAWATAVGAAV